ncbi:MAG: isocitrate/isopropylmalate family dehydrogenase [Firmicutes bacterium]|jgi:isocitrate dehydrogenase (NAD+)|nr:isocitrate/isopropylmalate family dehydrogenase [Bacillota bacterium]
MYNITLIPGDGIGPEVADATMKIINSTGVAIDWDIKNAGEAVFNETGTLVPEDVFESIEKNKIALKGPITTPIGTGFRSINVMLRKKYELYSNIRPVKSIEGVMEKYKDIDITIFRENTEGLYIGIEEEISKDEYHSIKKITRKGCDRIIRKAFDYAVKMKREKVTVVHKANILKLTDGLFLEMAREIAKEYPGVKYDEFIIDNMCMQLVMNPNQFDVIVTMNLYGDILSDLCAGFIGGLGLAPGANIGDDIAIFEAVHGSAPDIAGKNLANPTALLLSGCMMLEHLNEHEASGKIRAALDKILKDKTKITGDLGGTATTTQFTDAIIEEINSSK